MNGFRACSFLLLVALAVGCSKGDKKDPTNNDPKGGPAAGGKLTAENVGRIQKGVSTLEDVRQIFGSRGEMTNDQKPGLGEGSRWVWKEDNRKVYVSIDINAKVSGVAWEGFGGK